MSEQPTTVTRPGRLRTGPSSWIVAPVLAFFAVFALVPLVGVFVLSFMSWDGLGAMGFVGLSNWKQMLSNDVTQHAILLTLAMTVLCWLIQTPLSLLLGVFMAGLVLHSNLLLQLYLSFPFFTSNKNIFAIQKIIAP